MPSTPPFLFNPASASAYHCRRFKRMRIALQCVFAFIVLVFSLGLHAQGTSFVYPLIVSPQDHPTYNEALTGYVEVRDQSSLTPLTGIVNFSVDGGPAIPATLDSLGQGFANLGQLSIGSHTITATYPGNAQESSGSISTTLQVGDVPLTFVGTQGTTLIGDGFLISIEGVAVDAQDNLYVSDNSSGAIYEEDTLGNVKKLPLTGLKNPVGMALDSAGNLYVADTGNNRIVEYSTSGTQTVVPITTLKNPTYLTYDRYSDILYVLDVGKQSNRKLYACHQGLRRCGYRNDSIAKPFHRRVWRYSLLGSQCRLHGA